MQIDTEKLNAKFATAYPAGVPADIVDLITGRLDAGHYWHVQQAVRPRRDQASDRANQAGDRVRQLKTHAPALEARAAELKRQIDSADPLGVTPAAMGDMLTELAGCERLTQRMADALAQAQQAERDAKQVYDELTALNHIVDQLTNHWMGMTNERKAELLADFLTDAEHARFFTPEYLEQKRIAQEKAEAERKQAQEREEEHRRWKAEQRAAERAPYERIDKMTVPEILADIFAPLPPPETLLWHVRTRQAIHEGCSPHLWNFRNDAMKTYALNQIIHRVSQNLPID